MELSQARAKLMAIGGSEDKEHDMVILKEFVRLARGPRARIVVMTVATDSPKEVGDEYEALFKRLGVDDVRQVDVSTRADTEAERALEALEHATGVFFTGGDQLHITSFLGGSKMHNLLIKKASKGTVIAGTSAGASMMGNSMILGGEPDINPRLGAVEIGPGMDFFIGAIIDVHFSQRGRIGRLITAVAHFPQDLGIGLDEDTAIVATDHHIEVIGSGAATIVDAGGITYTNLPDLQKDENISLYDIRVHVLGDGHRFSLETRTPVPKEARADRKPRKNGSPQKSKGNGKGQSAKAGAGK
ncbi:MAG TPA: cyanophycinase [Blastocatellia bacterium]|nr:cyanophycinase [Blastocatellia bacterium]